MKPLQQELLAVSQRNMVGAKNDLLLKKTIRTFLVENKFWFLPKTSVTKEEKYLNEQVIEATIGGQCQ